MALLNNFVDVGWHGKNEEGEPREGNTTTEAKMGKEKWKRAGWEEEKRKTACHLVEDVKGAILVANGLELVSLCHGHRKEKGERWGKKKRNEPVKRQLERLFFFEKVSSQKVRETKTARMGERARKSRQKIHTEHMHFIIE